MEITCRISAPIIFISLYDPLTIAYLHGKRRIWVQTFVGKIIYILEAVIVDL